MLAEEGDDLSAIEVPKDLGPEGSSSSSASASTSSSEPPKEESKPKAEEKKEEPKAQTSEKEVGHGHKTITHPKPLFPSVSRL